ncbi:hypothetical protein G6011_06775 [Alternaria panax]|uniref:Uncharacterized protein n=1 Tax=Alternaria panax TaxID=48097 RepID=A0AAD4FH30_9PLEO|nr:hypothetical protein G6011_06775 [Alternaria panax]
MYRLSTQSTSTTDVVAAPREDVAFSPLAIVCGIHSALVEKSYPQRPNVRPSILEAFGERLRERVQREVAAVLLGNDLDPRTDWESRVFRPIIAAFDIFEELRVNRGDSEYIFLLVTTLLLAFELLLLAGRDYARAEKAHTFLAQTFQYIFVEPEICRKVVDVLGVERARLIRIDAGMDVLRAIQGVRMLIPDDTTCTATWDTYILDSLRGNDRDHYFHQTVLRRTLPEPEVRPFMYGNKSVTKFLREAETFAPQERLVVHSFDVEVKLFRKHRRPWMVNYVTHTNDSGGRLTMHTDQGLRIEPEPDCSFAAIEGVPFAMSVKMPAGSINGFIATIYVPIGRELRVDKVSEVREKTRDVDWIVVETAHEVLEIVQGDFRIRRLNWGSRVIVENAHR